MSTAIDTNVIVALWNEQESLNRAAASALEAAQTKGSLVISAAVYAELLAAPGRSAEEIGQFCEDTGIVVEWIFSEHMWRAAGLAFQSYAARRRKQSESQPRRILADFLVGAHAWVNGHDLLTLDARLYRAAFPKLRLVTF